MQYTGVSIAEAVIRLIPAAEINNETTEEAAALPVLTAPLALGSCGAPPAALNKKLPNVLIIGDR